MGLNDRPSGERVHISFFGLRNAGKSSVVNAVTGQALSLVSQVKGTTTDPVQKAMELLPIGPVVIIDTPGIDDVGGLGQMRVQRALQVLDKTDVAILVVDGTLGMQPDDRQLTEQFQTRNIPYLVVYNKADLLDDISDYPIGERNIPICARSGVGMDELLTRIEETLLGELHEVTLLLPYAQGGALDVLHQQAQVHNVEYTAEGIVVQLTCKDELYRRYQQFERKGE